jgi:ATP/maltotriose-dependent transcriptional regulator MalT
LTTGGRSEQVLAGREAFARRDWRDAYAGLRAVEGLEPADLECLAVAAHLVGEDQESAGAWERAHLGWAEAGEPDRAARCAFWVGLAFVLRGEMARGGGWLARAERLLGELPTDCRARGYMLLPAFLQVLGDDPTAAAGMAADMVALGRSWRDVDLVAFGLLGLGEAALAQGDAAGMRLLDEAMVSVIAGEVSPIPAGIIYCAVIEACMNHFDVRRAAEWTGALTDWCAAQPDLVPYRGQCLVHRSQILQARGAWPEAVSEADRARERLSHPTHAALGAACYQQGELHRLRGEFPAAEAAYRAAHQQGRDPVPGMVLLRLAEGNIGAAAAATTRILDESRGRADFPMVLAAAVEVWLATGDLDRAREAAAALGAAAVPSCAPLLRAIADAARGAVGLAEGEAHAALGPLRRAARELRALDLPYDEAKVRVQVGLACRAAGDGDAAALELDAARSTFERLGAAPDLERVTKLAGADPARTPCELTARECEVLRLVAAGRTNRAIAGDLVISEHTVARHLQNIFLKLDLTSRAAATAYAYEHGLV